MKSSERIQRYLDGEMKGEELKSFLSDLQINQELADEFELHRLVDESIRRRNEHKFRTKLEEEYDSFEKQDRQMATGSARRKKIRNLLIFSAAAILIAGLFISLVYTRNDNHSLFKKYYSIASVDFNIRSISEMPSNASLLNEGIEAFQAQDYDKSRVKLEKYLAGNPEQVHTANYFLGLTCLELKHFQEAEKYLRKVAEGDFSYYREHSQWYLALTLLKENKLQEAKNKFGEISGGNSIHSDEASKILKKYPRIK